MTSADTGPRTGPRPLWLHLAAGWAVWGGAGAAVPATASPSMRAAVASEALERLRAFAAGVAAYHGHPARRVLVDPPILPHRRIRDGAATQDGPRLLDHAGAMPAGAPKSRPALLVVPSLINPHTVLDLAAGRSLVRHLASEGWRVFLVDWGDLARGLPQAGLDEVIAGELSAMLDAVVAETGRPAVLAGYCMGGLLTTALAALRPEATAGLVALASPWDFRAQAPERAAFVAETGRVFDPVMRATGRLPVDVVQWLFFALDPLLVLRKFVRFAAMDPASPAAEAFVLLEDWVNGGGDLPAGVARDTLGGWYGENAPARGLWRVAGETVLASRIRAPALVAVPRRDRIVPPADALALAAALPEPAVLRVDAGHVGMVVGSGARDGLWRPLTDWLASAPLSRARRAPTLRRHGPAVAGPGPEGTGP